jgi:hypothetical protein
LQIEHAAPMPRMWRSTRRRRIPLLRLHDELLFAAPRDEARSWDAAH